MIHLTINMIPQTDAKLADHTYMIISAIGLVQLSVNLQGLGVVVGPIVGPVVGSVVGTVVGPGVGPLVGPVVGPVVGFVQLSVKVQLSHGIVV